MKTKLLLILLLTSVISWAQDPITSFYPGSDAIYNIVNSSSPVDQSASGANATWTFDNLSTIGFSSDDYPTVTAEDMALYPGTTTNTRTSSDVDLMISESRIYSKNVSNEVSITAVKNSQIELNFVTDNATLGTFPLNYGYSLTDNLAGTYINGTYTGTCNGTITTSVDGFGTLNSNVDNTGVISQQVTRLKSVQNITLNYSILTNVGTIVQTVYNYYTSGSSTPVFRTTKIVVNVPLLSIDQTIEQMERKLIFIGVNENEASANTILMLPNPTEDVLTINNKTMEAIQSISITDMSGRVVMQSNGNVSSLSISHLQKGLYIANIETGAKTLTQKIIKE